MKKQNTPHLLASIQDDCRNIYYHLHGLAKNDNAFFIIGDSYLLQTILKPIYGGTGIVLSQKSPFLFFSANAQKQFIIYSSSEYKIHQFVAIVCIRDQSLLNLIRPIVPQFDDQKLWGIRLDIDNGQEIMQPFAKTKDGQLKLFDGIVMKYAMHSVIEPLLYRNEITEQNQYEMSQKTLQIAHDVQSWWAIEKETLLQELNFK